MTQYSGNFFLSGGNDLGTEGTSYGAKAARSILCLLLLFGAACSKRIEAGSSGILEKSDSEYKSADEIELLHGKVYYNPFTEDVHSFSHAMHRVKWTFDDDHEENSKEIIFSSYGGAVVKSAMEMGYTYKPGRIPHVFITLRNTEGMVVEDYMWRSTHKAVNECAGKLPMEAIYGPQKTDITLCALEKLRQRSFIRDNFELDYLNFVGRFRFDAIIWDAINYDISTRIGTRASKLENDARREREILDARTKKEVMRLEAEGLDRLNSSLTNDLLVYLEREPLSVPAPPALLGPWSLEALQCVR